MPRSKTDGVNKSQAIRDAITANPKAKRRRQKRERVTSTSKMFGVANPVELILKVKALAAEAGGIDNLKQLVDAMAG